MSYELPELPYAYDALEPFIDAKTTIFSSYSMRLSLKSHDEINIIKQIN